MDRITCKECGEKVHYSGNSECYSRTNLKEDAEAFREMKQGNSANKPPGGGEQKALVNIKDTSGSLMMGAPTREWDDPPIYWTYVLPNLNTRVPTDRAYQQQD